jgi:DNA primase
LRLLKTAQPVPPQDRSERAGATEIHRSPTTGNAADHVKSRVAIEDVVSRYVPLRRIGQNLVARCPFHEDHHPSLVIYPGTQSFYCFGCHAHGDVASFLMRVENLTFAEALRTLRELAL